VVAIGGKVMREPGAIAKGDIAVILQPIATGMAAPDDEKKGRLTTGPQCLPQ